MYSQIVSCLKLLTTRNLGYQELTLALHSNIDQVSQLISYINQQEPNLVIYKLGKLHLTRDIDYLDIKNLTSALPQYSIVILETVDSTSNYILANIDKLNPKSLVASEFQFAGRGRRDNKWLSGIANDLTCSVLYELPDSFNYDPLPLSISIAIHRTLKNLDVPCKIKWPNDILLLDGRKISGVLIDVIRRNNINYAIIGIGIDNLLNWNRTELLISLIDNLQIVLDEYMLFGFSLHRQEWLDNCIHYNKLTEIHHLDGEVASGLHSNLTLSGELELTTNIGAKLYNSSSVSLRFKLNKYNLLIDAGNSVIKFAIYESDKLFKIITVATDKMDLTAVKHLNQLFKFESILGSSVISLAKTQLINKTITNIRWVMPVREAYGLTLSPAMKPSELGSDIWLMALAGYQKLKRNVIVVSCGTAFVVTAINAEGTLVGVKIIAGVVKQLEVLTISTAKIDLNCEGGVYQDFPTNTPDAVISGVIDAYLGILNTMLSKCYNDSITKPIVLVNGGYSKWFSSFITDAEVQVYDNLVLDGLRYFL